MLIEERIYSCAYICKGKPRLISDHSMKRELISFVDLMY